MEVPAGDAHPWKVFHVTSVFPSQAIATPTDKLLSLIYKGAFPKLQKYIEDYEP